MISKPQQEQNTQDFLSAFVSDELSMLACLSEIAQFKLQRDLTFLLLQDHVLTWHDLV